MPPLPSEPALGGSLSVDGGQGSSRENHAPPVLPCTKLVSNSLHSGKVETELKEAHAQSDKQEVESRLW